ncbi:MAG: hypothetical protein MdMp014T_2052 [Treponematales bacterium]
MNGTNKLRLLKAAGALIIGMALLTGLVSCKTDDDDDSPSKPAVLATSASYADFTAKCDEVIAYCDKVGGTTNSQIKTGVQALKSAIASYSSYWSSVRSQYVTTLNTYINSLE